jgi:hypothetical protein
MKTLSATLAFLALLSWGAACQAGIVVAAEAAADDDGAVECIGTWDSGSQTMTVDGRQYGEIGHVGTEELTNRAFFQAEHEDDPEDDPTVTLMTSIDNDTGFAWTGYHVNVYMAKPFTISLPTVSTAGWSVTGLGSFPETAVLNLATGKYEASVDFAGSPPIPSGTGLNNETDPGTLDFGYKLSFIGSVNYCQEMIPVPEPSMIALAISGLVGLLVVRRKFAR